MGMEFVNDLAANNIIDYGLVSKINRAYGTTSRNNQGTYNAFVRVSAPDTFTRSTREKETMVTGGLLAGTAALTGVAIAKGKKATKKGIAGIKETFSKIFNKKTVETAAEATTAAAGTPAGAAATETAVKEAKGLKKVWKSIPKPVKIIGGIVAGGAIALKTASTIMVNNYMKQNQAAMQAQAMANADVQLQNLQA